MGIIQELRKERENRTSEEYIDLEDRLDVGSDTFQPPAEAEIQVHIAEISDQQDLTAIKDAVYDGDMVIVDITRLRIDDKTTEQTIDQLRQTANETGGDIVKKGDDQIIITPSTIAINREKLHRTPPETPEPVQ